MRMFLTSLLLLLFQFVHAQAVRIATYQYASNNRIANITPFAEHLHQSFGYEVEVKSYPSVHSFLAGIQNNEVDIAFLNTFGYLLLQASSKAYPMQAVAALQTPPTASDNYKSALVTTRKSGIQHMSQLKKEAERLRLALVNPGSTSGNLMPRLAIKKAGIDSIEATFQSFQYSQNHAAALQLLLNGQADIAGMGYTEFLLLQKKDSASASQLQLIWVSSEIPLGPVLFNKRFGSAIGGELLQSLTSLHQKNEKALGAIKAGWSEAKQATHFAPINSHYYDSFVKAAGSRKDIESVLANFQF